MLILACSTMLCIASTIIQLIKLDGCLCGGSCQLSRIEKILFKFFQNQSLDILVSTNAI